jgi:drug/metabolite transporter (DMT)-like permease
VNSRTAFEYTAMVLIFGLAWVALKEGLSYWPPFLYSACVIGGAAVVNGIVLVVQRVPLVWNWKTAYAPMVYGVMQALVMMATYWGQLYVPAGRSALINATIPAFALVMGALIWRVSVTWRQILSLALALLGVSLSLGHVTGGGFAGSALARYGAQGLLLMSAGLSAFSITWLQRHPVPDVPIPATTFIRLVTGAVVLGLASLLWEPVAGSPHLTPLSLACLGYLAVVDWFLGTTLWFVLMPKVSNLLLAMTTVISAVLAIVFGALLLHESLSVMGALGGAMVLGATVLLIREGTPRGGPRHPPVPSSSLDR